MSKLTSDSLLSYAAHFLKFCFPQLPLISFFCVDSIINNVNIDFIFLKETFADNMRSVSLFRFRAMTSWPFF
jgi:hypothetical protein